MPRTRAQAADPTALDLPYLSSTYGVAEPEIQILIDAPTAELVRDFLASLINKGHEIETLKSEKLKVDVELENTVRTAEAKVKAQKAQVTKHAKEAEELRRKLHEAEIAREALASELEQVRLSTSGSTAETEALKQRIETLEALHRDTLSLVDSKSTEKDRLETELSEQHGKLLALRREISQLEERNQALENTVSSQKFKEQSLQQEIDLLKGNVEWHSNELQTRNQEHAKFRKERNAHVASLQRELEDANSNVDTLKRTETTLRQRLEEVQAKVDDAFKRIAQLQDEAATKEQNYRTELDSRKRLADLQAQNAATDKARMQELQGQVEQLKDDAAEEIGRLQVEIETERSDKEQAERKVAELELTVERLEQQPRLSRPGTPMRNGSLDPNTPGRAGSPAMPGSMRKTVGGLSFTQLYTQFTETQQELENERRRTNKLTAAMDSMINEMESRSPEILELKADQERLEQEVLEYSQVLEEANQTRDNAVKEAQHWQSEAAAASREGDILRQQLRDLSAQVKMLLVEIQSRDQGLDDMSVDERLALERAARGELDDAALQQMTDTGRFIAERLVIFRGVSDLQEKNQQMLRLVETLGDQLEGDEAQEKQRQTAAYATENEALKQKVQRLQDELQATVTQLDSYMKERDMFRRMLQHRGQLAPDADLQSMFGQSMGPPATPQRNGGMMEPPTPRSKDVEDLNKLLKEQQTFFDQYRNETANDRRTLKDQVDSLARDKSTLQADIARAQSQLTLASERYEMLQSNFAALRNENLELVKRSQSMAENAAKQDLRTQQVAEELVEARSMAESLRNENANAKAEKELWKRIEARLTDDNKGLMDERSRLNKLVTDLQNLQNEREMADSETRRRLQARTETLEAELAETKRKLDHEVEESRKVVLRREYEEGQSRTRIDDLVKSLGHVREELVAAKTTRDQLQARVDEMKIELRAAEEKVAALQPRPTPRAETQQRPNGETEELPVEQRLAVEVSELRRDLELAQNELEAARQQAEQYRAISQASEEELASFNETSEQYKNETDQQLSEKDDRIKELEQRIEDLNAELTTSNNELSTLRTQHAEAARALDEQKANFEAELARLRDDAERHAEEKKLYQEDLKAQAEIAQQAQQSYEDELLKHAEAAKSLQSVRKEYNELRTEVAGVRAEAEAAKVKLEQGETSWEEQKEGFERELEEVKRRRADVDAQNKLLHEQMEGFSRELAALRQGRATAANEPEEAGSPSRGDGNLQEVIKYLRREKEIVDVQYELSMQEAKRLQQQLEYANAQLEETRQKLADERRAGVERAANEGTTEKLMQTINELNLFRESSTTLRNEAREAREKLEAKSQEVERLLAEMDPLRGRIGELEGELEAKDGEMRSLQQDRDHWRERTQNIISKYDRVDPAELESLKVQLEEVKTEKERLEAEQTPLREQIEGFDAKLAEHAKPYEERLTKFRDQAKEQNRKQNDRLRETNAELTTTRAELESVKGELEETKTALQEAKAKTEGGDEEGEVREDGDEHAALHARIAEAEGHASEHAARAEEMAGQVATLQGRVEELEGQVVELEQQLEDARNQLSADGQGEVARGGDTETLEKLQQDLATAQQEVETLRANAAATPSQQQTTSTTAETGDGDETTAQQIEAAVARTRSEMDAQHQLAISQMKEDHDRKIEVMKTNLRRQLADKKDQYQEEARQELIVQHSAEIQKLRDEHDAAINELKEVHHSELERLSKEGGAAVQKAESAAVKTEQQAAGSDLKLADFPDEQVMELIKTNAKVKGILANNIRNRVAAETETLKKQVAEKDEEIAKLQQAQGAAASDVDRDELAKQVEALQAEKADLAGQLEAAKKEKENAVRQAIDNAEKKAKVQISQRDMAQAKLAVVKKAADETPERAVKEVWDEAQKARPAPKPAAPATTTTASPAAKPANVPAPSPAQAPVAANQQSTQTPEQVEQAKLQARKERFGTNGSPAPASPSQQTQSPTTTFGQPSAAPATKPTFGQPSAAPATTSSFGKPSQPAGALAQPARRPSIAANAVAPNPNAPAFTPSTSVNAGTGPAALRGITSGIPQPRGGASGLPRGGGAVGRGGISIQGAANQAQQGAGQRGGLASALPRGGGNIGRGGRGGGPRGGGSGLNNAGQKRPHDGAEGGDGKRQRGGGGPGGAA